MAKRSRLRKELWLRWAIWIAWVVLGPIVLWNCSEPFLLLLFLSSVWVLGGWFGFILWGPGKILGRVWNIDILRKERIRQQFIEDWEMMNPRWVPSPRRRRHWIKKMKYFAESSYVDETGERMYVMPLLSQPLPLDYFEEIADYDYWKSYVDIYIDWDEFNEYYPETDNFADYDSKSRSKINRMEDDMLYGRILNEGGRSGRDYRVVPSHVRKWFPPYTAEDGLVTVHEDTIGSEGYDVDAFDTTRGDDEMYDFPDEDPEDDEEEEEYDDDDDDDIYDPYFDKYYDRHMRWIREMKHRCRYEGGGPAGKDVWSSPYLWQKLPLNDFEFYAGSETFNYRVSNFIDWDRFRENFPDLETWEDDE